MLNAYNKKKHFERFILYYIKYIQKTLKKSIYLNIQNEFESNNHSR